MRRLRLVLCIALSSQAALGAAFAAEAPPALQISGDALAGAAMQRTHAKVTYNGAYRALDYPGGDVPADQGVCTDVLIRTYRALGIDLQVLVHEDMQANFSAYPTRWGLSKPDANIDHRRVPNLETFFARAGSRLPLAGTPPNQSTKHAVLPGDVVSFRLDRALPHIGIVSNQKVPNTERYYVVHNVGSGPKAEDVLPHYPLAGHYRFLPELPAQ